LLNLEFSFTLDPKQIQNRKSTLWRYREAIPIIDDANIVSLDEGHTPLLALRFHEHLVHIKQDYLFPTNSFKDRGATVLISKAKELGITSVVEDSSGNAGSAIATYAALAGIGCRIFVPENTSAEKTVLIQSAGARLEKIPGTREDTAAAALRAAQSTYYASHTWNPYFFHGTKTFAYEIAEQMGWQSPDVLILPAGNGTLVIGSYIGFSEMVRLGIIERIPKIIVIQTEAVAPLYRTFHDGSSEIDPVISQPTIAEGIAIAQPVRGKEILRIVRQTEGTVLTVSEDEIRQALTSMSNLGFMIEPTSAAAIAGIELYTASSDRQEKIVSLFTGHGLKTTILHRL
jgi:threonine synthase